MHNRHMHTTTLLGAALALSAGAAHAQDIRFQPFSADAIVTEGREQHRTKVYVTEQAMRTEADMGGQQGVTIARYDRKVIWTVMPGQRMYMEIPITGTAEDRSFGEAVHDPTAKIERQALGTERVGAYTCTKYRVRVTSQGATYTGVQWAAKELNGFAVKLLDEKTGTTLEYQHVRLGAPAPSLFEVPPGYQKMSMPGMERP